MKLEERCSVAAKIASTLQALIHSNKTCGHFAVLILLLSGLHLLMFPLSALAESPSKEKIGRIRQWSVQIDKVYSGDVSPDPSFGPTIDKNLLGEVAKTKQFKQVLRSGDRNANDVPDLLTLKTTVQDSSPTIDTHPGTLADAGVLGAVAEFFLKLGRRTPVIGINMLRVHIQLYTRKGRLVLEGVVERDVPYIIGDNSRAIHKLAQNIAVTLKRSTLPDPAITAPEQEKGATASNESDKSSVR